MQDRKPIIIGSRGSDLALWQARFVQQELALAGYRSEISIIKTQGDIVQHLSLEKLEGKGFFTKEIEEALLAGTIDIAVHSHKDLPTAQTPGLCIAGVSYREDPSELLLIRKDKTNAHLPYHVPEGATVGTSSARRFVQLMRERPDIKCIDIRGNVPTRIQKLRDGLYDAILIAYAGVHRLNLQLDDLTVIKIDPKQFIPAPAQGVLAYQCRENDAEMRAIIQQFHHDDVAESIQVERRVMQLFNGGCHMPLGVYCEKQGAIWHAWAVRSIDRDGEVSRLYMQHDAPGYLADAIYARLQHKHHQTVLICSTQVPDIVLEQCASSGISVTRQSFIDITPYPINQQAIDADWVFFTSKHGVKHFFEQQPLLHQQVRFGAYSEDTAAALAMYQQVHFTGNGDIQQTAKDFQKVAAGSAVLFAGAVNPHTGFAEAVSEFATTGHLTVYNNTLLPAQAPTADIIVFSSPMQAEGFLIENNILPQQRLVAIGKTTRDYLLSRGFTQVILPYQPSFRAVADLLCGL